MIRINLLPIRAAKKKESVRFQITIAAMVTVFVIIATLLIYVSYINDASALSTDIEKGEAELVVLKRKIGELDRLKGQKKVLENKLKIVKKLEEGRKGPVEMFARLSNAIPEKAWLTIMKESGGSITMEGMAAYDDVIADFMRNLTAVGFNDVELVVAKRIRGRGDLVNFTLKVGK